MADVETRGTSEEHTLRDAAVADLRQIRSLVDNALHRVLTLGEAEDALDQVHSLCCQDDDEDEEPDEDEPDEGDGA